MQLGNNDNQRLQEAKRNVRRLKIFYIHLVGYIVLVALLCYNLYIVEGPYKNNIISLNLSILVSWTVFILLHAWRVFKERKIFKKSWEDKKIASYLEKDEIEETKMWE